MKIKLILTVTLIFLLFTLLPIGASGHGGKTDGSGGHYDNSTGEYHYHHGYPAHSHTGGECPYDFDDKTDHSSGNSGNKDHSTENKTTNTALKIVVSSFGWSLLAIPFIYLLYFSGRYIVGIFVENDRVLNLILCALIVLCLVISVIVVF